MTMTKEKILERARRRALGAEKAKLLKPKESKNSANSKIINSEYEEERKVEEIAAQFSEIIRSLSELRDDVYLSSDPSVSKSIENTAKYVKEINKIIEDQRAIETRLLSRVNIYLGHELEEEIDDNKKLSEPKKSIGLRDSFTHRKPCGMLFMGHHYQKINSWKNIYLKVIKLLIDIDEEKMSEIVRSDLLSTRNGKPKISKSREGMRSYQRISGKTSSYYVETHVSANIVKENLMVILSHYEIPYEEIEIFIRLEA